jgi:hypothetical protein
MSDHLASASEVLASELQHGRCKLVLIQCLHEEGPEGMRKLVQYVLSN